MGILRQKDEPRILGGEDRLRLLGSKSTQQPAKGLARYEFEQDVTDSWNNNDAVNNGATFTTQSQVGSFAADFDGIDDTIDNSGFDISNTGLTISFWAYARDINPNESRVVFFGDAPPQFEIELHGGNWVALYYDGSNVQGSVSTPATQDAWNHVTYVWRDSQKAQLYIDGSLQDTTPHSSSASFVGTQNRIGRHGTGGGGYYDGLLDDIRYYNKGLTDNEVSNLYNTGSI